MDEFAPPGGMPQEQEPHTYPHHLGEVDAAVLSQDIAANPDAYHPGLDPHMEANGIDVQRPAFETEAVEAAEAEPVRSHNWAEIAATVPLSLAHKQEHEDLGEQLDPDYDSRTPDEQRAIAVVAELGDTAKNWEYGEDGNLQHTFGGSFDAGKQAQSFLDQEGLIADKDKDLAHVIAKEIDSNRDDLLAKGQRNLDQLNKVPITPANAPQLDGLKADIQSRMNVLPEPRVARDALTEEFSEREKADVEMAIKDRIEADKLPWTMPNSKLPPKFVDDVKHVYENIIGQETEPKPGDMFRVPAPMRKIEGGKLFSPDDEQMLLAAGVDPSASIHFKREDLQRAGVFFVNRVGAGEQPIFGMPIPDPEGQDGVFNVQDRTFLTQAEFEKVYKYQQEHGYGVGDLDPKDVQTDMLMFAAKSESRKPDMKVYGGFGGREDKYGVARSPFVDSGFLKKGTGVEPGVYGPDGYRRRMNTLTIHLVNGHPDYPGVSEMFDERVTSQDQRYMSAGEFVEKFYIAPPTEQEALQSMKQEYPTARERAWVGPLREEYAQAYGQ